MIPELVTSKQKQGNGRGKACSAKPLAAKYTREESIHYSTSTHKLEPLVAAWPVDSMLWTGDATNRLGMTTIPLLSTMMIAMRTNKQL